MKRVNRKLSDSIPAISQHIIRDVYFPRIECCLSALSSEEIWWRANPACNSVGNLVLHLEGNLRQWIVSGMGGAKDIRVRDREFSEQGPISRRALLSQLHRAVQRSCAVLRHLSPLDLRQIYSIQGYSVTGTQAVFHVTEHFSHHAGQIIYITKLRKGKDLGFTRLPADRKRLARKELQAV